MRAASARRRALIARLAALALLCLGLAVSGCGADDEPAAKPAKPPELTIPETDAPTTTETTETTETAPAPTTTEPATPTETTPPADTPENDTPPPAGSPADKFESFCNDNPGACG